MFFSYKPVVFSLLLVGGIEANLRVHHRQLSQEKINAFTPITQVTDHVSCLCSFLLMSIGMDG